MTHNFDRTFFLLGIVAAMRFGLPHGVCRRWASWRFMFCQTGVAILVNGTFLIDGGQDTALLPTGAVTTVAGAAVILVMSAKHDHTTA
jgi:peptidoglycan/LPS O-acetylase OafA/YrhL